MELLSWKENWSKNYYLLPRKEWNSLCEPNWRLFVWTKKERVCTMAVKWKWLNSAENTFVKLWIFHKNMAMKIKMLLQKTISLYCLLGDWTQFSFGRCVISSWLPLRCCSTWVWYSAVVVRVCDKLYRVTFISAYVFSFSITFY